MKLTPIAKPSHNIKDSTSDRYHTAPDSTFEGGINDSTVTNEWDNLGASEIDETEAEQLLGEGKKLFGKHKELEGLASKLELPPDFDALVDQAHQNLEKNQSDREVMPDDWKRKLMEALNGGKQQPRKDWLKAGRILGKRGHRQLKKHLEQDWSRIPDKKLTQEQLLDQFLKPLSNQLAESKDQLKQLFEQTGKNPLNHFNGFMFPHLIEVKGKVLFLQMVQDNKRADTAAYNLVISSIVKSHHEKEHRQNLRPKHEVRITTTRNTGFYDGLDRHHGLVSFKVLGDQLFVFLNRKGHLTRPDTEQPNCRQDMHTVFLLKFDLQTFEQTIHRTFHLQQQDFVYACFFDSTSSCSLKDEHIGLVTRYNRSRVNMKVLRMDLGVQVEEPAELTDQAIARNSINLTRLNSIVKGLYLQQKQELATHDEESNSESSESDEEQLRKPKPGQLYELESHPGYGLKLFRGGEAVGHNYYFVRKVPLAQAMLFTAPASPHDDFKGTKHVRCLNLKDAQLDCSWGKYGEGNIVLAFTNHNWENQTFFMDEQRRLYPCMNDKVRVSGNEEEARLEHPDHEDVFRFKDYGDSKLVHQDSTLHRIRSICELAKLRHGFVCCKLDEQERRMLLKRFQELAISQPSKLQLYKSILLVSDLRNKDSKTLFLAYDTVEESQSQIIELNQEQIQVVKEFLRDLKLHRTSSFTTVSQSEQGTRLVTDRLNCCNRMKILDDQLNKLGLQVSKHQLESCSKHLDASKFDDTWLVTCSMLHNQLTRETTLIFGSSLNEIDCEPVIIQVINSAKRQVDESIKFYKYRPPQTMDYNILSDTEKLMVQLGLEVETEAEVTIGQAQEIGWLQQFFPPLIMWPETFTDHQEKFQSLNTVFNALEFFYKIESGKVTNKVELKQLKWDKLVADRKPRLVPKTFEVNILDKQCGLNPYGFYNFSQKGVYDMLFGLIDDDLNLIKETIISIEGISQKWTQFVQCSEFELVQGMKDNELGSLHLRVKYALLVKWGPYHWELHEISVLISQGEQGLSLRSAITGLINIFTQKEYSLFLKPLIESNAQGTDGQKSHDIHGVILHQGDVAIKIWTDQDKVPWLVSCSKLTLGHVIEAGYYLITYSQIRDELLSIVLNEEGERMSRVKEHWRESLNWMQKHLLRAPDLSNLANQINQSLSDDIYSSYCSKLISADLESGDSVLEHLQDAQLIKENPSLRYGRRTDNTAAILDEIESSGQSFASCLERMITNHPDKSSFLASLVKQGCFEPYYQVGVLDFDGESILRRIVQLLEQKYLQSMMLDTELFEAILALIQSSKIPEDDKRTQIDSVLMTIFVRLPSIVNGKKDLILKDLLDYFKEPQEQSHFADEEDHSGQAAFRKPLESELLRKYSTSIHKSRAISSPKELVVDLLKEPVKLADPALTTSTFLQREFIRLITGGTILENKRRWFNWIYPEENHFVEFSFLRFDLLQKAELLHQILEARSVTAMKQLFNYQFDHIALSKLNHGILKMAQADRREVTDYQVTRDMINHNFMSKGMTQQGFQLQFWRFFGLIVLPILAEMAIPNLPASHEGYKWTAEAWTIRALNAVAALNQLLNLTKEFQSMANREKLKDYFDLQNTMDLFAIFFLLGYASLRISKPFGANIADAADDATKASTLELMMPILGNIQLILLAIQFSFPISTFETMAKWIQLLKKVVKDAVGFILFQVGLITFFFFVFRVLGVIFDDGKNFSSKYDDKHNDYPNVDSWFVGALSVFRTSIGDLQPPQYPFWDKLIDKKKGVAKFYIRVIWIMWVFMILINVIFLLNFLIAIVSQSYEELIESQEKAILDSKQELNAEYLFMNKSDPEINKPICYLVMATMKNEDADGQWHGLTRKVRQTIKHYDSKSSVRDMALLSNVEKTKEQLKQVEARIEARMQSIKNDVKTQQNEVFQEVQHVKDTVKAQSKQIIERMDEVESQNQEMRDMLRQLIEKKQVDDFSVESQILDTEEHKEEIEVSYEQRRKTLVKQVTLFKDDKSMLNQLLDVFTDKQPQEPTQKSSSNSEA